MSETELHSGKFRIFERNPEESTKDYFVRFLKYKNIEYDVNNLEECEDDYDLREFLSRYQGHWRRAKFEVMRHNNAIIDFIEHIYHEDSDINHMELNADGTFSFVTSFYNGGTSLDEMLTEAYRKIVGE